MERLTPNTTSSHGVISKPRDLEFIALDAFYKGPFPLKEYSDGRSISQIKER